MPRAPDEYNNMNIDDGFEHKTNLFQEFVNVNMRNRRRKGRRFLKNYNKPTREGNVWVAEEGETSDFILKMTEQDKDVDNFALTKQGIISAFQHENRYNIPNKKGFIPSDGQKSVLARSDINDIRTFAGLSKLPPAEQKKILTQLGLL